VHLITQSVCTTLVYRAMYSISEIPSTASSRPLSVRYDAGVPSDVLNLGDTQHRQQPALVSAVRMPGRGQGELPELPLLAQSSAAITEARRLAHPPSLAVSLAIGARVLSLVGDNAILHEWVNQLVAVTTERGFPNLTFGTLGSAPKSANVSRLSVLRR
jgi:hypothetical protein